MGHESLTNTSNKRCAADWFKEDVLQNNVITIKKSYVYKD